MQDKAKWNADHKLLDNAQELSVTLYWNGSAWVDLSKPASEWHYMVIHTTHKSALTTNVTVEKQFVGIEANQIPTSFALKYSFDGGTTWETDELTASNKSGDGLTWTWTVPVPNGKSLTLKEVNATVAGYTLTTATTTAGGTTGIGGDLTDVDLTQRKTSRSTRTAAFLATSIPPRSRSPRPPVSGAILWSTMRTRPSPSPG